MTNSIPEGYHAVQPCLTFKDAQKAIEFYKEAFGAKEQYLMPGPRGKGVMHAEVKIGDSVIMLADESAEMGCRGVESYGGSPVAFYVYVNDADALFKQAVEAGAQTVEPMADAFWGDRMGCVKDPFGLTWTLATHKKDLSPEEIRKGSEEFMAQHTGTRG